MYKSFFFSNPGAGLLSNAGLTVVFIINPIHKIIMNIIIIKLYHKSYIVSLIFKKFNNYLSDYRSSRSSSSELSFYALASSSSTPGVVSDGSLSLLSSDWLSKCTFAQIKT
jgi:hypothetical protein